MNQVLRGLYNFEFFYALDLHYLYLKCFVQSKINTKVSLIGLAKASDLNC